MSPQLRTCFRALSECRRSSSRTASSNKMPPCQRGSEGGLSMNSTIVPAPATTVAAPSMAENVGHSRRHIDDRAGVEGSTGAARGASDIVFAGAAGAADDRNELAATTVDAAKLAQKPGTSYLVPTRRHPAR